MPLKKLITSISIFDSSMSAADWAWRLFTIVFISGSSVLTAFLAKAEPELKALGPIYWVAIGVFTALIISIIFYLIKSSAFKQSQIDLNKALSIPRNTINPLLESFKDFVIPVEDLRLPVTQIHENKHFKRCKLVGPAAIAIMGGTYKNTNFFECGDIIALPDNVLVSGVVVLKNCTVEECEFIRTTILTDKGTAQGFALVPGSSVKGL